MLSNFFIVSSLLSGILFKKLITIAVLAPLRDASLSIIAFVMFNGIPPYTGILVTKFTISGIINTTNKIIIIIHVLVSIMDTSKFLFFPLISIDTFLCTRFWI